MWISKGKLLSSFCNSKATFTKTVIKRKLVDRFSLKNFSASIYQCTMKHKHCRVTILGDRGAVSRAGRKGATKVFKHRQKSLWVLTLTGPFPNGQANTRSWLGTKNALYYCAQSANNFSWVFFVATVARFVHQAFLVLSGYQQKWS